MKTKLFIIVLVAIAFIGCKTDEPKAFKISATDMINIKPVAGTKLKVKSLNDTVAHLTALEIVRETSLICDIDTLGSKWTRTFISEQRDTVSATPKLLMWATDVITLDGNLQTDWIKAKDVVFVRSLTPNDIHHNLDTIAYIPNSVLRSAETAIKAAYTAKDIDACFTLFNTAYTFTPITGAEWRELKRQGLN
jgi:hypothetical protein